MYRQVYYRPGREPGQGRRGYAAVRKQPGKYYLKWYKPGRSVYWKRVTAPPWHTGAERHRILMWRLWWSNAAYRLRDEWL